MNGYIIMAGILVIAVITIIIMRKRKQNSRIEMGYSPSLTQSSGGLMSRAKSSLKNLACCLKGSGA